MKAGDRALFPDAITERGRKHLLALVDRVNAGERAVLMFVVQRSDVLSVGLADAIDPAYGEALRSALETARAARPHLAVGGSMLFMTSASTKQPVGVLAMSTVFRAGVAALAKLLADAWAADGIRVNHLIPGRIATPRLISLDADAAARSGSTPEAVRAGIEARG